jgi:hypothetical protein
METAIADPRTDQAADPDDAAVGIRRRSGGAAAAHGLGMKPSVSVCMKLTNAFSSSSVRPEVPDLARDHILGRFRCGPAACRFPGVMGPTARQHVARVVEMHDGLQALEISIVPIGLDELRIVPLVDVAQRRHSKSPSILGRQGKPPRIHGRWLTERMAAGEEAADAAVDK